MSELGENEEGVGEEQIPETFSRLSLVPQENIILGGKKSFFFFYLCPPTPVMEVVLRELP